MLDILLINSPLYDRKVKNDEQFLPPFGLGYIGNELKKNNLKVELLDCVLDNLTMSEIVEFIQSKQPKFVGINIFSVNFELVKKIIEKYPDDTTFLVGGRSTKALYKEILSFETENKIVVVIGEGDYIVSDIVQGNVKERPSYTWGENRIIYTVDSKSIYFPHDLSLLSPDRELFKNRVLVNVFGHKEASIITSRECIFDCAFCGAARSLNRNIPIRECSEPAIKHELEAIATLNPEVEDIRVLDDLFLKNQTSAEKAIRIFSNFAYEWRAMAHVISLKNIEISALRALKTSGCKELEIGIESGDSQIRRLINKKGSISDILKVIADILNVGINVKGYFIYGFPDETLEQCQKTFELAQKISQIAKNTTARFRASAFIFRPYHGTKLYNLVLQSHRKISFSHDDTLNGLSKRSQFNFSAGNFSKCPEESLKDFVIRTNMLK